MNTNKNIVLLIVAIFTICISQTDKSNAQNLDTRRGYDLRGHGFDSAMRFVNLYYPQLQVIVGVASTDIQFISAIKQIVRDLDEQGYEGITLIVHDLHSENKLNGKNYGVSFYLKGNPISSISNINNKWGITFVNDAYKLDLDNIVLNSTKTKYPLALIRIQLKALFKKT